MALVCLLSGCGKPIQADIFSIPCIRPLHAYTYYTCDDLCFAVDDKQFKIQATFETDLASIPRIFWPIMAPTNSSYMASAIIHDWLYKEKLYSRYESDLIFYALLRSEGVTTLESLVMYYCVRLFGWPFYDKESQYGQTRNGNVDQEV